MLKSSSRSLHVEDGAAPPTHSCILDYLSYLRTKVFRNKNFKRTILSLFHNYSSGGRSIQILCVVSECSNTKV